MDCAVILSFYHWLITSALTGSKQMDIAEIRRQYSALSLDRTDLQDNPIDQFNIWIEQALESKLFTDPTAMSVATVDEHGMPSQRIVLLKHFDQNGFVFYTNLESQKAKQIRHNPKVCLHFGWVALERQIIIRGEAEKLSVAEATKYFLSRPHESQLAAWASHQSQTIGTRKLLEQAYQQMKNKFAKGEVPLPGFWGGYRVKPISIEFWQGRENRLHDRFLYQISEHNEWEINRLQP